VDLWAAYQPIMIYSTSCVGHVRPIAGAVCICGAADQVSKLISLVESYGFECVSFLVAGCGFVGCISAYNNL
jgi:hypothetical protein